MNIITELSKLPTANLSEGANHHFGITQKVTDNELLAAVIATKLENREHATAVFWDLHKGRANSETIQDMLNIAYPTCSPKTAAHHLCRFRNHQRHLADPSQPNKYKPKYQTKYAVTGGRGGRIQSANIGTLDDSLMAKLAKLLG